MLTISSPAAAAPLKVSTPMKPRTTVPFGRFVPYRLVCRR